MRVETIQQYTILRWIDERFEPGSLKIVFLNRDTAKITDRNGETAVIHCTEYGSVCFNPDSAE